MKNWVRVTLLFASITSASCGKSDNSTVVIKEGTVKRVNGCHVVLDKILRPKNVEEPFGSFRSVCKVEESALNTKEWWGTQPQPLQFPLSDGDCTRLEKTFYCVEEINRSDGTVTLKATYEQRHWDGALLERIK